MQPQSTAAQISDARRTQAAHIWLPAYKLSSRLRMIPHRIFQILITDGGVGEVSVTDTFERNLASLTSTYPGVPYHRYSNEELLDFLRDHFPSDVLAAYRALRPYAFKADLARYCLLHADGGLYSDLSYLHLRPIVMPADRNLVVFRDIPGHPAWSTSNALILAAPGSPVMERAINRVLAHFRSRYHGLSPLDPTGPYMFGRVLAEGEDWKSVLFGDSRLLNVDATGRPNIIKVMPTGEMVAIRNKTKDCQISDLVVSGGNNYNQIWQNGRVWDGVKSAVVQETPAPRSGNGWLKRLRRVTRGASRNG